MINRWADRRMVTKPQESYLTCWAMLGNTISLRVFVSVRLYPFDFLHIGSKQTSIGIHSLHYDLWSSSVHTQFIRPILSLTYSKKYEDQWNSGEICTVTWVFHRHDSNQKRIIFSNQFLQITNGKNTTIRPR